MWAAPLGSETAKLNVWLAPEPEEGVRDTTDGGALAFVQAPVCCQPVFRPALSPASRKIRFVPENAGLKASLKLNVRTLPARDSEEPAGSTLHCVLDCLLYT